ncbi:MAG TPA: ABC transporter permease [Acidimicrobiales bacterium]|nr:ABC transporter permease [Acidimicrobiales bacterium]
MTTTTIDPSGTTLSPGASVIVSTLTVAGRTVKKFVRTPQLIVAGTAQGALFLLIFRYVFGGAVGHTGSLSYVDFLVPGFVATSVLFTGMGASAGVAEDLSLGLMDRLRSLPISRFSIIDGNVWANTALMTLSLAITTGIGFAIGFRIHGTAADALGAFGMCALYGFAFVWLFVALGLFAGSPQAAQSLSFLVFPLTFVSSAYVPVSTMPGWMQPFANHQPVTVMVDTVRILTEGHAAQAVLGHSLGYYLPVSLAWCALIVGVAAPLAIIRLRR